MNTSHHESPHSDESVHLVQSLFLKHSNSIRGFLFAIAVDEHSVDDAMHSAFLVITAKAEQYDQERNFVPWARGIARNELLKAMSAQNRRPVLLSPAALDLLQQDVPSFDVDPERISAVLECVEELSPRAKQAVLLRYQQGFKPPEIAGRMHVKVASVNVMLSKSRVALRRCVEFKLRRRDG